MKINKILLILGAASVSAVILLKPLEACTGLKLTAQDGAVVHGRTLEFGVPVEIKAVVVPRGYEFQGTTPKGPGLKYKAKYAATGMIAYNNPAIMDGINETGLSVGAFFFPGYAEYAKTSSENQSKSLSPIEFPNWILTQFATLDEVKEALSQVSIAETVVKGWGEASPPLHYIVYNKEGDALVIEPINGKLITYDNSLGVITNSPTFDWHMTNLRNYINLTDVNAQPVNLNNVLLAPFGQGSGLVGMPGDFTPPSRFVRAAIFSTTATPPKNSDDAVFEVFHLLNQFDIPVGVVRDIEEGSQHNDSTLATCVKDPKTLKYYFKTYDDQAIKYIDLQKSNPIGRTIRQAGTQGREKAFDITEKLK